MLIKVLKFAFKGRISSCILINYAQLWRQILFERTLLLRLVLGLLSNVVRAFSGFAGL